MKTHISSHSGLPEHIELQMFEEKAERMRALRNEQKDAIRKILNTMPPDIRRRFLLEIVREYTQ